MLTHALVIIQKVYIINNCAVYRGVVLGEQCDIERVRRLISLPEVNK